MAITKAADKINKTPQEMQNLGFDTEFNLPTVEALVYNSSTGGMDRMVQSIDLVPTAFDYIALTYVAAGNGVGEVETAIFKTGGSGGTTVATLTLTYNASNEVATVTKA